ncbi:hypothetical protein [Paludisphaera mucosa]|uniref:Uncharacterized protein n=1 Tax=Paludisphaera mucosa TaxID=3030827 RepID=A0ABT6FLN3_9BACT|nr:hypothetical protein [Paludisphaera mucosa]MDG3008439.1 hypothetical protein [Paludisphaera mucosa]
MLQPSDEALASAESITSALPRPLPKPSEAVRETITDAEERPWRGVYAIEHGDKVLFTKRIDITASTLREWEPDPIIERRFDEDDD